MKKLSSVFLALFLLLIFVSAEAAEFDFSSMTNDELIALRLSVFQELMDRGAVKSATVPAGTYTVGVDIPAGDYSISTSQIMVTVVIGNYDQLYVVTPDNGVGKVTLKDGDTFQVTSTVLLTKYAGLTFE